MRNLLILLLICFLSMSGFGDGWHPELPSDGQDFNDAFSSVRDNNDAIQGSGGIPTSTGWTDLKTKAPKADVTAFGAAGDGETNDLVAIHLARDTGLTVYFPTPSVAYYIGNGVIAANNNSQSWEGENKYGSIILGGGSNAQIILVTGINNRFENLTVSTGVIGIQIGTATTKANSPVLTNFYATNCSTAGIYGLHANNGRLTNVFTNACGIGLSLDGAVSANVNGWFVDGARFFHTGNTGTGIKFTTSSFHQFFGCSTEGLDTAINYSDAGSTRNVVWLYDEDATTQVNNAGSRSNHTYLILAESTPTFTGSGGMSGFLYGTDPRQYMLANMVTAVRIATFTSSGKSLGPIGFRSFTTVNNTNALGTLNLINLDSVDNEAQPELFFFPAANSFSIDVTLNEPAGNTFISTNQTTTNKYRVFPTGDPQLFELTSLGSTLFSFREIGDKLPYGTTTTTLTANIETNVDTAHKNNRVIILANATGSSWDYTLADWNDARVGHTLHIYKGVTTSNVVLKVADATFPDTTTSATLTAATEYAIRLTKLVTGATSIVGYEDMNE